MSYFQGKLTAFFRMKGFMLFNVAFDTETTGFTERHEIIQIAAVPCQNFEPDLKNAFVSYIRPDKPHLCDPGSLEVNKLSLKMLKKAPSQKEVRKNFLEWIKRLGQDPKISPLGQNVDFDIRFIRRWLGFKTFEKYFSITRDTRIVAAFLKDSGVLHSESRTNLTDLSRYFKIKRRKHHDALDDAVATIKVYKELIKLVGK
jgi:DNA polymerase III epsilon subunit-like protein